MKNKTILVLSMLMIGHVHSANKVSTLVTNYNGSGGLVVDQQGNIFSANFGERLTNANGTTISKISPSGDISQFAEGFVGASGITIDEDGFILQSNINGGSVSRVSPSGDVSTLIDNGLSGPVGVVTDSQGNVFVANCRGNYISVINSNKEISVFSGSSLFRCPNGLTIDQDDNLYAVNFFDGTIVKITPEGVDSEFASIVSEQNNLGGNGHIIYSHNKLYVTSHFLKQVYQVDLDGSATVLAGTGDSGHNDGDALSATFGAINGIAASPDGTKIYVSETVALGTINSVALNPNNLRVIELEQNINQFEINAGLSGAWSRELTNGSGFLIDVIESRKEVFAAWFTWETNTSTQSLTKNKGESNIGSSDHRWFSAFGSYEGNKANLDLYLSEGGVFETMTNVSSTIIGSLNLEFLNCTTVLVNYNLVDEALSDTIELNRTTPDQLCDVLQSMN